MKIVLDEQDLEVIASLVQDKKEMGINTLFTLEFGIGLYIKYTWIRQKKYGDFLEIDTITCHDAEVEYDTDILRSLL